MPQFKMLDLTASGVGGKRSKSEESSESVNLNCAICAQRRDQSRDGRVGGTFPNTAAYSRRVAMSARQSPPMSAALQDRR
jgi:hypothetical protein